MIETFRVRLALLFATCFCCEKSQINANQTTRKPNLLSQKYRLSRSIFFTALETMLLSAMASNSCSKLPLATSYEEQAYLFDLFFFPVISPLSDSLRRMRSSLQWRGLRPLGRALPPLREIFRVSSFSSQP